jgi:aerobic-type carbon monoxide dehydrogenase small subunit (CoxS/CutS family)
LKKGQKGVHIDNMAEEKKKESSGISRREFLKDAGILAGGAAIGSTALLAACAGEGAVTTETITQTKIVTVVPGITEAAKVINFTLNGRAYQAQVEAGWTLQDLLHDRIGLTGVKDMCFGYGACGSCSVIKDGLPILSCMTLAIECDGAVIETAEGIADANHPLIDAYILNNCMQCGYCTPGFLVTAKALLDHSPKPTEEEIREALAGNICRCGTYPQHILAVLEAAEQA